MGNSTQINGTAIDFQVRFGSGAIVEDYDQLFPRFSGKNAGALAFRELLTSHGGALRCLLEPNIGNPNVTEEVAHCEW